MATFFLTPAANARWCDADAISTSYFRYLRARRIRLPHSLSTSCRPSGSLFRCLATFLRLSTNHQFATGGPKGSDDGAPAPAVSEDTWAPKLARLRDGVAEGAADGEATPAVRVAVGPGDGKPALLSSRLGSLDGAAVREGFVDGSDEETVLPRRGRRWTDEPVPVVAGRVVPEFGTAVDDDDAGRRRMPCRFDCARARGQPRRSTRRQWCRDRRMKRTSSVNSRVSVGRVGGGPTRKRCRMNRIGRGARWELTGD